MIGAERLEEFMKVVDGGRLTYYQGGASEDGGDEGDQREEGGGREKPD
jgi:hypothetical protein